VELAAIRLSINAWTTALFSRRALDQAERMLIAVPIDAEGGDQHQVVADMAGRRSGRSAGRARNWVGSRKGVLERVVKCLFLVPTRLLSAIVITLMLDNVLGGDAQDAAVESGDPLSPLVRRFDHDAKSAPVARGRDFFLTWC
jgi:hypothetical protein